MIIQFFFFFLRCGGLMIPVLISTNGTQWSCECGNIQNDDDLRLSYDMHTSVLKRVDNDHWKVQDVRSLETERMAKYAAWLEREE